MVPESGRVEVGEGGGSVPVPSPSEARVELLVRRGAIVLAFSRARERADYAVTVRLRMVSDGSSEKAEAVEAGSAGLAREGRKWIWIGRAGVGSVQEGGKGKKITTSVTR